MKNFIVTVALLCNLFVKTSLHIMFNIVLLEQGFLKKNIIFSLDWKIYFVFFFTLFLVSLLDTIINQSWDWVSKFLPRLFHIFWSLETLLLTFLCFIWMTPLHDVLIPRLCTCRVLYTTECCLWDHSNLVNSKISHHICLVLKKSSMNLSILI